MNQFFKPRILAWSYSRLSTWEGCPAKAKYKFIDRLKEPDSPYAARGTDLHTLAENYITGKIDKMPVQLQDVDEYIEPLKGGEAELQLAFDEHWNPVPWFGPQVYCRVVLDAVKLTPPTAIVADHKSGKKREKEHTEQLRLYALAAFRQWPTVDEVEAQIIYIDHGERLRMRFHRDSLTEIKEYWDARAAKMRADDLFSPRPGPGCKWCHYRKTNGGPCIFG
jgi:CRISPR/Cas system-associated exonuclease Cas4 (RecB family)